MLFKILAFINIDIIYHPLFVVTFTLLVQLFTLFDLLNNLIKKLVMIQYNKTELARVSG
jgi:hypothetical protein